jgi:nitrogen fixation protein
MTIKVTYNVTDVYVTQDVSPVYINVSYSGGASGGAAVWGGITGTLSNQTDLQNALNAKFDDPTGTTSQYLRGDGSLATFPSLTGYVPYTGATTNVNLGEYEIKAGQLTLDTSPTGTAAVGTTRWNDTIGSSETTLKGGSVILKNGVDLVARIVNKVTPNTTLTKAAYQAVRVSGAQGQRLAVAFAQANNDANSADTIGLVTETIPTNQEGFIITVGQIENINTTGSLQGETWVDGDVLYLSPTTAGAITKVKPTGSGHIVVIGYVEYAHANNGKIYVKVMNGWELDELHDVSITSVANNEALIYESSTALWKNKSIATALGYTPANAATTITINGVTFDLSANRSWTVAAGISGSGASGQVAYWTGTSAQSGSNNLFWDAANGRLGIGTNAPAQKLEIEGNARLNGAYPFMRLDPTAWNGGIFLVQAGVTINASAAGNYTIIANSQTTRGFAFNQGANQSMVIMPTTYNVLINSSSDSGERLQVTGTTKLAGDTTVSGGNFLTSYNWNGATYAIVRNQTSGTNAQAYAGFISDSNAGSCTFGKYSSTTTAAKIISARDFYLYNSNVAGDISILNDFASGNIKFAAGGSSTAHMTIKSNGRINMSSLPTSSTGLATGDLWNDAGTIKIV